MRTLNFSIQGRLFGLDTPAVMGILNVTPDSFYTGGSDYSPEALLRQAETMIQDGADILDLGAVSTRPGAGIISAEDEWNRLAPVLRRIKSAFPEQILSVDTYRAEIARRSVAEGAGMINDISAGNLDENMLRTVGRLGVPYIAMHMQGRPSDMQKNPEYTDLIDEILRFFIAKIAACEAAGIKDLLLDPGFGFGKNLQHNYALLKNLHQFQLLKKPLLIGLSRKSMIYKLLDIPADQALNGTTALHMLALEQGATMLRVHDVRQAAECIRLWNFYKSA